MSKRRHSDRAARRRHAPVLAALGDETRLALIVKLSSGAPRSISSLAEGSGMSRQAVTKHLRVLEHAGLVRGLRVGRQRLFEPDPEPLDEVRRYLDGVSRAWDEALARLKSFVESDRR